MTRRAFTLIELLLFIAILAVVLALLLPALARARQAGQESVCRANLRGMAQGLVAESNGPMQGAAPIETDTNIHCPADPIDPARCSYSWIVHGTDLGAPLINWANVDDSANWSQIEVATDYLDFRHGLKSGERMDPSPYSPQWLRSWRNKGMKDGHVEAKRGPLSDDAGVWLP